MNDEHGGMNKIKIDWSKELPIYIMPNGKRYRLQDMTDRTILLTQID